MKGLQCFVCVWIATVLRPGQSVTVTVGDEVNLTCSLDATFPIWEGPISLATPLTSAGGVVNQDGMEYVDDKNLRILNATTNHTGDYKCKDGVGEAAIHLDVNSYDVTFQLGDENADITITVEEMSTITCIVTGGYPRPEVVISFPAVSNLSSAEIQTTLFIESRSDNTFKVVVNVTAKGIYEMENSYVRCTADFAEFAQTRDVTKQIYFRVPPLLLSISSQSASMTNNRANFTCRTATRPETTFSWAINDDPVVRPTYDFDIYDKQEMDPVALRTDSTSILSLRNLKKEDNGKMVKCFFHYDGQQNYTDTSTDIMFNFSPTMVTITGNVTGLVSASGTGTVTLTCSFDESTSSSLNWYRQSRSNKNKLNSTYAIEESPGRYNAVNKSQIIDIEVDRTMNGENILCCDYDLCETVVLDVLYPPIIIAPQLAVYRAYDGDSIDILCGADSNPDAMMQWFEVDSNGTLTFLDAITVDPVQSNFHTLSLNNVNANTSGEYRCYAWHVTATRETGVFKSVQVSVVVKPVEPMFFAHALGSEMNYIDITTSETAPSVPRSFYVQYKKDGSQTWLEVAQEFTDILPGQEETTSRFMFSDDMLEANTKYDVRIKSVDAYGLVMYTASKDFFVGETAQSKAEAEAKAKEEETVSKAAFRNAILISVFATAAFFLIVIIIIVCCIKKGCSESSSSKSYAM